MANRHRNAGRRAPVTGANPAETTASVRFSLNPEQMQITWLAAARDALTGLERLRIDAICRSVLFNATATPPEPRQVDSDDEIPPAPRNAPAAGHE